MAGAGHVRYVAKTGHHHASSKQDDYFGEAVQQAQQVNYGERGGHSCRPYGYHHRAITGLSQGYHRTIWLHNDITGPSGCSMQRPPPTPPPDLIQLVLANIGVMEPHIAAKCKSSAGSPGVCSCRHGRRSGHWHRHRHRRRCRHMQE